MRRVPYFAEDNVDRVARSMRDELAPFRAKHPLRIPAQEAALLLIDLQQYFARPSSHAHVSSLAPIVPRLLALARAFSARGRPVFATRHVRSPDPTDPMQRWWVHAIPPEDPDSRLIEPLLRLHPITLPKTAYDAFLGTTLDARLRADGTSHIVIGGVHTHLCCETTARGAFMRGYDVSILIDGTATYDPDFHLGSLRHLAHGFAVPALCSEVVEEISRRGAP